MSHCRTLLRALTPRAGAGLQPQPVLPTRVHCVTTHVSVALKGDCKLTSGGVDVRLGHAGSVHTRGPRPCGHGVGWVRSPPRSRGNSKESASHNFKLASGCHEGIVIKVRGENTTELSNV